MFKNSKLIIFLFTICLSYSFCHLAFSKAKKKTKDDYPDIISKIRSIVNISHSVAPITGSISSLYEQDLFKLRLTENGTINIYDYTHDSSKYLYNICIFSSEPYTQFYKYCNERLEEDTNYIERGYYILKINRRIDAENEHLEQTGYKLQLNFSTTEQDDHGGNSLQKYSNTLISHNAKQKVTVSGNFNTDYPYEDTDIFRVRIPAIGYYSLKFDYLADGNSINFNLIDNNGTQFIKQNYLNENGQNFNTILAPGDYTLMLQGLENNFDYRFTSSFEALDKDDLRIVNGSFEYTAQDLIILQNSANKDPSLFSRLKNIFGSNSYGLPMKKKIKFQGLLSKYHISSVIDSTGKKTINRFDLHSNTDQEKYKLSFFGQKKFLGDLFNGLPNGSKKVYSIRYLYRVRLSEERFCNPSVSKVYVHQLNNITKIRSKFDFGELKPAKGRFKLELSPYEP